MSISPPGPVLLDLRGLRCPVPVLKLQAAIRQTGTESPVFKVLTDDPVAKIDIPHGARQAGFQAVILAENGDSCDFLVTRATEIRGSDNK